MEKDFEDTVKNLLKTPHKPHKPAKAKKEPDSDVREQADESSNTSLRED